MSSWKALESYRQDIVQVLPSNTVPGNGVQRQSDLRLGGCLEAGRPGWPGMTPAIVDPIALLALVQGQCAKAVCVSDSCCIQNCLTSMV